KSVFCQGENEVGVKFRNRLIVKNATEIAGSKDIGIGGVNGIESGCFSAKVFHHTLDPLLGHVGNDQPGAYAMQFTSQAIADVTAALDSYDLATQVTAAPVMLCRSLHGAKDTVGCLGRGIAGTSLQAGYVLRFLQY